MVFYSRFKEGNKSPKWSGKVSKYKAVYNDIKSKINDGILPPKQELPSESELMQEYGFSKDTIRKALSLLELLLFSNIIYLPLNSFLKSKPLAS